MVPLDLGWAQPAGQVTTTLIVKGNVERELTLSVEDLKGLPVRRVDEGRIALVSLKDTRPGPRHVKWLQSIELRTLAD